MFIIPQTQEELDNFKPDFTIYNSCKKFDMAYMQVMVYTEVYVIFNVENTIIIVELGMRWWK